MRTDERLLLTLAKNQLMAGGSGDPPTCGRSSLVAGSGDSKIEEFPGARAAERRDVRAYSSVVCLARVYCQRGTVMEWATNLVASPPWHAPSHNDRKTACWPHGRIWALHCQSQSSPLHFIAPHFLVGSQTSWSIELARKEVGHASYIDLIWRRMALVFPNVIHWGNIWAYWCCESP